MKYALGLTYDLMWNIRFIVGSGLAAIGDMVDDALDCWGDDE